MHDLQVSDDGRSCEVVSRQGREEVLRWVVASAAGSGQWAVDSGQWVVGNGQWAVGSWQRAVGSE